MTDDELLDAVRLRRANPVTRIDMDTIPVPPLYAVAVDAAIMDANRRLGFSMPRLLERIYAEVGNGGFGPGGGMIGLEGGCPDADGRVLPVKYEYYRLHGWRDKLLPLWDWGCGALSCVDAGTIDGNVVTVDDAGLTLTRFMLKSWLEHWVGGIDLHSEIYQIEQDTIMNPFTRQPMTIMRRGQAKGVRI